MCFMEYVKENIVKENIEYVNVYILIIMRVIMTVPRRHRPEGRKET